MSKQPPSSRAYEHAVFTFGLVTIPVSVYSGTAPASIKRNMFTDVPVLDENGNQKMQKVEHEDGSTEEVPVVESHPIGYGAVDKITNEPVSRDQVIKKVATEYGHVFVDDHELEGLFDITPKSIVVKEFQPQSLFFQGHYVPRALYFIEASKTTQGKKKIENKAAQTSLALVLKAMKEENALAVVEFTVRGVPKPAILMPTGALWIVYHTNELREQRPLPEIELDEAVVAQGRMLLKTQWGDQPLDLTDRRTELIQQYADDKARAGDFGRSEEVEVAPAQEAASTDLAALLAASVAQAKAAREESA